MSIITDPQRWLSRWPVHALATGGALVVMLVTASLPSSHWTVPQTGLIVLVVLAWLPLVFRMRWPIGVLVATTAIEALHLALATSHQSLPASPVPEATMLATYTVARYRSRRVAWLGTAGAAIVLFTVAAAFRPGPVLLASNLGIVNAVVLAGAAGWLVKDWRERLEAVEQRALQAEKARDGEARRAVTAERLRIAREMHDVLAHNIALVNAQASVAKYLLPSDPEAAAKALGDIETHSRSALEELRATVGMLRYEDNQVDYVRHPLPGWETVGELFESFRAAGVTLVVDIVGTPQPLAPAADLAIYRIMQEAITNATKHASGAEVFVTITWGLGRVQLDVTNPSPVTVHPTSLPHHRSGSGHGLIGMRERAVSAGGTFVSGETYDGGYFVTVTLMCESPYEAPHAAGAKEFGAA